MARTRHRPKGLGSIYKRGVWWIIRWREGGKRKNDKFPDKATAEKALAKRLSDVALGRYGIETEKPLAPPLDELAEAWIERRKVTNRSWMDDRCRWRTHCKKPFGKMRPDELNHAAIRELIEKMLAPDPKRKHCPEGFTPSTCHRVVALLSSLFTDLVERGLAKENPAKTLPRPIRRLLKSLHDSRQVPFVEKTEDIGRIYRALPHPVNIAYAVGAMAGLRTGEILALRWANVQFGERPKIVVCEQVQGGQIFRPKDKDIRTVQIVDSLLPLLKAAKLASGGAELVVPPMRKRWCKDRIHLGDHTLGKCLKEALAALGLPAMTWYMATRHTCASQNVLNGMPIEKVKEMLGHSSVLTTQAHYVHMRGDVLNSVDLARVKVDFEGKEGKVIPLVQPQNPIGHRQATEAESTEGTGPASGGEIACDSR